VTEEPAACTSGYDLIGDIHGYAEELSALLTKLGYAERDGAWRHEIRRVIYLGDFIDRGPHQKEVIGIVRPMIESGAALAVMGNHEFNALAFHTNDPDTGNPLREWSAKNSGQHKAFTDAYAESPEEMNDVLAWFKTLPLWLDLGDIRVIHACWDKLAIVEIEENLDGANLLSDELLVTANRQGTWQHKAIETLLKGKEIRLPEGRVIPDKEGNHRHNLRVRWWDEGATNYRAAYLGPESALTHIPEDDIEGEHLVEYAHDDPPCFLGHYWLEGNPTPLAPNIACLDYSVAKPHGKLVAYRWDGERQIVADKFLGVERGQSR
jgi:hypothetical protein